MKTYRFEPEKWEEQHENIGYYQLSEMLFNHFQYPKSFKYWSFLEKLLSHLFQEGIRDLHWDVLVALVMMGLQ